MPRMARLVVKGEPAVYHVICRSALDGFALGDVEKEYFVKLLRGNRSLPPAGRYQAAAGKGMDVGASPLRPRAIV